MSSSTRSEKRSATKAAKLASVTPRLLTRDMAAVYLGCGPKHLANLATSGGGPPFKKPFGGNPVYDVRDLDAWIDAMPSFTSTPRSK